MRKRKTQKTITPTAQRGGEDEERAEGCRDNNDKEDSSKFHACYLLTSLSPRFKGHTYIGYTVNPRRRIRQHNGEIGCGAWRTKRKRPWEMVLCIYGFPTNVAALQFEWAWQHPLESLAVRSTAAGFKSISGLANKIKLAFAMLSLPPWKSLNLTVNLFSTKYQTHTTACPALPEQMRIEIRCMNELPLYDDKWHGSGSDSLDNEVSGHKEECDASYSFAKSTVDNDCDDDDDYRVNCYVLEEQQNPAERDPEEDYEYCDLRTRLERFAAEEAKSSPEEDHHQQSLCGDDYCDSPPPVRAPSSSSSSSSSSSFVTSPRGVFLSSHVVDENLQRDSSVKKCSGFGGDVEVIEVFTPSPCFTKKRRKKAAAAAAYTDVIDLTTSPLPPIFV